MIANSNSSIICDTCIHRVMCKYKNEMEKYNEELKKSYEEHEDLQNVALVKLSCSLFATKNVSVR